MIVAVPRETAPNERRVALVPETVQKLVKSGVEVRVERGAGVNAAFPDDQFTQAGASIVDDSASLFSSADVLVTIGKLGDRTIPSLKRGATLVGFLNPLGDAAIVQQIASAGLTALAMEMVPRITRAQSMDALSSQSNIAGY